MYAEILPCKSTSFHKELCKYIYNTLRMIEPPDNRFLRLMVSFQKIYRTELVFTTWNKTDLLSGVNCVDIYTSALRLEGRFEAEHNHKPTALRLVCGLINTYTNRSNIYGTYVDVSTFNKDVYIKQYC